MKCLNDNQLNEQLAIFSLHVTTETLMLKLLLFTGAREAEAIKLRKKDLHSCAVFIRAVKGSHDRLVPVQKEFYNELISFSQSMADDDVLFPVTTRTVRNWWDKYKVCDLGAHCLRHTFGVRFYANTRDIHATKTALGHKNIQNTMVYLDFVEGISKLKKGIKGMWSKKVMGVA